MASAVSSGFPTMREVYLRIIPAPREPHIWARILSVNWQVKEAAWNWHSLMGHSHHMPGTLLGTAVRTLPEGSTAETKRKDLFPCVSCDVGVQAPTLELRRGGEMEGMEGKRREGKPLLYTHVLRRFARCYADAGRMNTF